MHLAEAWTSVEEAVERAALAHAEGTFYCVRDVVGRSSVVVQGVTEDVAQGLTEELQRVDGLEPYLGSPAVRLVDAESPLARVVESLRKPLRRLQNGHLVERLLTNESWLSEGEPLDLVDLPPVIAFYSFKGGVGRSTAAALTALAIAQRGHRVALLDLDLEAPGIESFFDVSEDAKPRYGVVDFLLERGVLGGGLNVDMGDYVVPVPDAAVEASGGSLVVVPAGDLSNRYVQKLGRVNLADQRRAGSERSPIVSMLRQLNEWRKLDYIIVDCRTGFTDIGGLTLNGLSMLDVLVFKSGPSDRRYLPVVLRHLQALRDSGEATEERAEQLARSFLLVYSMVDAPPRSEDAEAHRKELREFTSKQCWEQVFEPFGRSGYSYPGLDDVDTAFAPVPHDAVVIPYIRDFTHNGSAVALLAVQSELPERPHETLVRRILDVKLGRPEEVEESPRPVPDDAREAAFSVFKALTGTPGAEEDLATAEDFAQRFLPRRAYRALLDPRVFVVLGRKGAGKTALFQLLRHTDVLRTFCGRLGIDPNVVNSARWEVGYAFEGGFPSKDLFGDAFRSAAGDPDLLERLWRALLAFRTAQLEGISLRALPTWADCASTLVDDAAQREIREWLDALDARLLANEQTLYLAYDHLDVGLTTDPGRRSKFLSALITFWHGASRYWPRIRSKIFLREDLWVREVYTTDKSKIRDGVDRGSITWGGTDVYRVVLKRFGSSPSGQAFLRSETLWRSEFDQELDGVLGFVPPEDEEWVASCVSRVAGETMGGGKQPQKKGYVYSWLLDHSSDAQKTVRPRSMLLLFSGAAKVQVNPTATGPFFTPASFRSALRGEVSEQSIADLKAEYREEWSTPGGEWIPDTFQDFQRVWPVEEDALVQHLRNLGITDGHTMTQRMEAAGLFERRQRRGQSVTLQIPDVYLFGLNLTRKGD